MIRIVGIRFKDNGKIYDFDALDMDLRLGMRVIVETVRGIECGTVAEAIRMEREELTGKEYKPIVRIADEEDLRIVAANEKRERHAFEVCEEKIAKYGLDMSLVEADYAFDGSKILFYYTAPSRVDFRELVRDLAGTLRCRIELRQIGVRDETRMIGGLGICGQPFCCSRFLSDFHPVTIKMAKEQGLSINSAKISGACGRLMCCLGFEDETYRKLLAMTPKNGNVVQTPEGRGVVADSNLLTGAVSVKLDKKTDGLPVKFDRSEVRPVKGEENKPAQTGGKKN